MAFFRKKWGYIALFVILLIAGVFRFLDLSEVPPGVYPDEAKNANDAIQTLESGDYKVFYPENNGREGLHFWLTAASFSVFGVSIFSLKLVSAVAGFLAILAVYLATKELFNYIGDNAGAASPLLLQKAGREVTALMAAGLTSVSFWHINFSRIAFRAIWVPFLLALGLYLTFKAIRTKKIFPSLAAGAVWGLGFYTYIAFRLAIVIPVFMIAAAFLVYLYHNPPRIKKQSFKKWFKGVYLRDRWWVMGTLFVTAGAVLAPIAIHFLRNPETFTSRAGGISIFNAESPIFEFFKSLGIHIQMLFVNGDGNWRHNFSGEPQLMLPVGILFLGGVLFSIWSMRDGWKERNWRSIIAHSTLFVGIGAMLLPAALTKEGIPHALRAIGVIPFAYIFAAFGFLFFIRLIFSHRYHRAEIWPFGTGAVLIIVFLLASFQFTHYFSDWGKRDEVKSAFSADMVRIGRSLNTITDRAQAYFLVPDRGVHFTDPKEIFIDNERQRLPMSAQTVLFIQQTKERPVQNTKYVTDSQLPIAISDPSVIVPMNPNDDIKNLLSERYPAGEPLNINNTWMYGVNTDFQ